MAEALKVNKSLTTIDMYNNYNMGSEGCKHLAEALKINIGLINLNIASNNIGPEGCKYLAEALLINKTLTNLNISRNNIESKGCKFLSKSLKYNMTLTTINIDFNNIKNKGCKYLIEALKNNISLTSINIIENPAIRIEIIQKLMYLIKIENRSKYIKYNPNKHQYYRNYIKNNIETVMLLKTSNDSIMNILPNEILFHIFTFYLHLVFN